jgi:hypothetical protein
VLPNDRSAGVTRTTVAIVIVAALVDATRRSVAQVQDDATVPWIVGWLEHFAGSLIIATAMLWAVLFAANRLRRSIRQYVAIAVAIVASSVATWGLALAVDSAWETMGREGIPFEYSFWLLVAGSLRYAVLGALVAGAWLYFQAEEEAAATAHRLDLEAAELEAQAAQAELLVLEAQIEPHFLFNVLATVKRLFETDVPRAERMLDDLMRYLAIALPQMRASTSSLGREAALAGVFLDIQKIRMGRRLAYVVDIPPRLAGASMPPLMLPTLVENAVRHGIAPLPEGGSITIRAREEDALLHVEVSDSGRGFVATSGNGLGLANVRARLAALYGSMGHLGLSRVDPHGVCASITLPLSFGVDAGLVEPARPARVSA